MKKLNHWFNGLPAPRKKQVLFLFVLVFALLLILSLSYNKVSIKTGDVPRHIGHNLDSLTKKEKP